MNKNGLTVLFDYDSLVYNCVYKIASIQDIKEWIRDGRSRDWMEREITHLSINRLTQQTNNIFIEIEDTGIEISSIEYYLTVSKKPFRKSINPIYKANRKVNKWVGMVRKYLVEMDFAIIDDEFEADDLINDRAETLGETKCIICSIDKDMKTIAGIHFDYYRPRLLDENGERQLDKNGFRKVSPCRGLDIVTKVEANRFFWSQMIMGDAGDNIKGAKGFGKSKVKEVLQDDPTMYEENVLNAYVTAEYMQIKKRLNKEDPIVKKMSFKKWMIHIEDNDNIIDKELIFDQAKKEYELNYQMLRLGIEFRNKY